MHTFTSDQLLGFTSSLLHAPSFLLQLHRLLPYLALVRTVTYFLRCLASQSIGYGVAASICGSHITCERPARPGVSETSNRLLCSKEWFLTVGALVRFPVPEIRLLSLS